MSSTKQAPHDSWKIGVAVAVPLLVAIEVLGWLISPRCEDAYLTTALIIACVGIGWSVGMVLSPDTKTEEKKFLDVWKGISLFVSGYLISKIDPLIEALFKPEVIMNATDHLVAYRLVACFATVVIMTLLTYVLRVYAFTVGE